MWAAASGKHSIAPHCEWKIDDRANDVLHLNVTVTYIQERLLLMSPLSTSCNFASAALTPLTPRTVALNFTSFR